MQRVYNFIVVLVLLFASCFTSRAQGKLIKQSPSITTITGKTITVTALKPPVIDFPLNNHSVVKSSNYIPVSPDYYVRNLGFVCRVEYRIEKKLNLPLALRVRVGDLAYVNQLEGKK